jgi:hypothetical protein
MKSLVQAKKNENIAFGHPIIILKHINIFKEVVYDEENCSLNAYSFCGFMFF